MRFGLHVSIVLGVSCCLCSLVQAQLKERTDDQKAKATQSASDADLPKAAPTASPAKQPNSLNAYIALQQMVPNGHAFTVQNIELHRDAAVFRLKSGTVVLYGQVNGKTFGAAFTGDGELHLEPPNASERRQLQTVMKTSVLNEPFTQAAFLFTDSTAAELEAHAGPAASGNVNEPAQDMRTLYDRDLGLDMPLRLLETAIAPAAKGQFFSAMTKGRIFSKRLLYIQDPEGAPLISPDQVALLSSSGSGEYDITLGYRIHGQPDNRTRESYRIPAQLLDTRLDKSGAMPDSTAVTRVEALRDGVQVVQMKLYPTLRVSGVWDETGRSLDFVQGAKNRTYDSGHPPEEAFGIVLAQPLKRGEHIDITTKYAGKDVVIAEGNGNYYPIARESWYPNVDAGFGNYAQYRMTFHAPKGLQVVATGIKQNTSSDGLTTVWDSGVPLAAAGFSFGDFRTNPGPENMTVHVTGYANKEMPDRLQAVSDNVLGGLSTTSMLPVAVSQSSAALQVYTQYFGPLAYDHVAVTQQTPCSYGQSWPMLVYLPICAFWDDTVKHQLGQMEWRDPQYFRTVAAHEMAHQWWGHTVGFSSYRDQWMSEGFAVFSAGLYLMETNTTLDQYRQYWNEMRRRLVEKNAQGKRPVDVGPVTMGFRSSSSKAGDDVYSHLIYPKGGYILHMLEMLYWTPQYQQKPFQKAMHAFVEKYRNQVATTEDFKHVMEENLPPWAEVQGPRNLDWFFNEYVYGTDTPRYTSRIDFSEDAEGKTSLHFRITQSEVSNDFVMKVPLYVEFENKHAIRVGSLTLRGNSTLEQTVLLGKLASKPKNGILNMNNDVLCVQ